MTELLRKYVKLILESTPSKLAVRNSTLSADSTGFEQSHLDFASYEPEEERPMAPHLVWSEEQNKDPERDEDYGPVPPNQEPPHIFPDPYVRGQYDNVTWQR